MDINTKELAIVKTQVSKAVAAAQEIAVETEQDAVKATDLLTKIKQVGKVIKEKKEAITKPINEALKEVRSLFAPLEESYLEAERVVKSKIVAYSDKIEEENRKKQAQIEARVEKGTMKFETASTKLAEMKEPEAQVKGDTGTLRFRTDISFKITDEAKIPREFLVPDLVKIRSAVRAGQEIPGVKKVEVKTPVSGAIK